MTPRCHVSCQCHTNLALQVHDLYNHVSIKTHLYLKLPVVPVATGRVLFLFLSWYYEVVALGGPNSCSWLSPLTLHQCWTATLLSGTALGFPAAHNTARTAIHSVDCVAAKKVIMEKVNCVCAS